MGGKLAHFVEQWEELTQKKWILSIIWDGFSIPFNSTPPLSSVPISLSQSSSPLLREEITELLQKWAVERVQDPGTPVFFYSWLFLILKKKGKLCSVIDLSLLNQYIKKQPFKMETVKSVHQSILINDWAVSIDLTDTYLHILIHPESRKYLRFMFKDRVFQITALPYGMSLSLWIFTKLMDVIAAHLRQRAILLFPYLDDWLIRDLICNRLVSHITYCLQTVQSLVHSKSKEVRFDTSSDIYLDRDGISDSIKHSQGTSRSHQITTSDYQIISFSDASLGMNFPFSFGQTRCSSRLFSYSDSIYECFRCVFYLSGYLITFLSIIRFQINSMI